MRSLLVQLFLRRERFPVHFLTSQKERCSRCYYYSYSIYRNYIYERGKIRNRPTSSFSIQTKHSQSKISSLTCLIRILFLLIILVTSPTNSFQQTERERSGLHVGNCDFTSKFIVLSTLGKKGKEGFFPVNYQRWNIGYNGFSWMQCGDGRFNGYISYVIVITDNDEYMQNRR